MLSVMLHGGLSLDRTLIENVVEQCFIVFCIVLLFKNQSIESVGVAFVDRAIVKN